MHIPDLEGMIAEQETTFLICKNCGRKKEFHIKVYDFPSWTFELNCVVKYPDRSDKYESS